MNIQRTPWSSKVTVAGAFGLTALTLIFASGPSRSEAAPQPAPESERSASGAKRSRVDTDTYDVELKIAGDCKVNQDAALVLTIVPKGDYHINTKYPIKFKLVEPAPEGVRFPKPILKREDGAFEEKKGSFKVPFVATRAGKVTISGVLSTSVCSEKNCLMEKIDLEVEVDAK